MNTFDAMLSVVNGGQTAAQVIATVGHAAAREGYSAQVGTVTAEGPLTGRTVVRLGAVVLTAREGADAGTVNVFASWDAARAAFDELSPAPEGSPVGADEISLTASVE